MIKSFRHKGLAVLFYTGSARKVQAKHAARLNLILTMLNVATHAGQMLKGKPIGRYAVWVDENFRVTFRFDAANAVEVDYGDYH